jgi:PAS domain S-box-containing protein
MRRKFHHSIVFRIWFPFAISIVIVVVGALWWYPQRQKEAFTQNAVLQWKSIANNIALSVELSFKYDDFMGIQKSIEMATRTADFEFVAILEENEQGEEEVFVSNPSNYDTRKILQIDTNRFDVLSYPVSVDGFKGTVLIANSQASIQKKLDQLNFPVMVFFIALLAFGLSVFYLLANAISRPIKKVTRFAIQLQQQKYEFSIPVAHGRDEISHLNNSLINLKESLLEGEIRNREFSQQLETQIVKRTEALHAMTEELVQAQKVAGLCNFQIDVASKRFSSSGTFADVLNMSPDAVPNVEKLLQLIHEEDLEEFKVYLEQGGAFKMDLRIKPNLSKKARWYMIQANRIDLPTGQQILKGIIQDINSRKENEEILDRLSLVAKKTTNSVVMTDVNRKITWVNDSLLKLSGYSREEVIGMSPRMFQFEKTNPAIIEYIRTKLDQHQEVSAEILNRGKYGNEYWLKLDILPLRKPDGSITGYMAVEIDITEAKKKEEEINHLLGLTQSQNGRLMDFAHIVSHNLRSHSSNFDMLINLLGNKVEGLKDDEFFQLLNKASSNLSETINHLREIVAINESLDAGMVDVDLSIALEKVLVNTVALASEEQVQVINELQGPLIIEAIPAYIDSILLNLITNAIKYKSHDRSAFIRISAKQNPVFTEIHIQDNGLGIDLDLHRSKMFGMYKRFHRHKDARGLGLFITKNHIEVMGGTIDVKSEVNVGSTFIAKFRNEKIQYNLVD